LEFGIWIPPKAFRWWTDKTGTQYTINRIPLWWFVRLKWENPDDSETFNASDSFVTASLWKKMVILFAGVFVNFVAAWLCFTIAFTQWVTPINVIPDNAIQWESTSYLMPTYSFLKTSGMLVWEQEILPATVKWIGPDTLADEKWMLAGDVILSIDDVQVSNYTLSDELANYFWKTFDVRYMRGDEELLASVTCPEEECVLGVSIDMWQWQQLEPVTFKGISAVQAGWNEMIAETRLTFMILWTLVKNLSSFDKEKVKSSVNKLSWPVGIVKVWESIYNGQWIWMYIAFAGMISLALAVFNILPIPALDGWRALGVLIQEIFQLKPEKYFVIENYFNVIFFVLLMWLWIYIILLDLVRFRWVAVPGLG
jgi:regulator of sigma E protease